MTRRYADPVYRQCSLPCRRTWDRRRTIRPLTERRTPPPWWAKVGYNPENLQQGTLNLESRPLSQLGKS